MSLLYYLTADLCHRYRQNEPLCLFHYTPLEYLRCISLFHAYRLLSDDLAAVCDLVYVVDRCTRYLDASFESGDMICSIYFRVIPCLFAMSFKGTSSPEL